MEVLQEITFLYLLINLDIKKTMFLTY